jgi:hypothetical protein
VAKYDVIAVLSRATRIQREVRQRRFRRFPLFILELGDSDQVISRIAAPMRFNWQYALLVMVKSHQNVSKSDQSLQKKFW